MRMPLKKLADQGITRCAREKFKQIHLLKLLLGVLRTTGLKQKGCASTREIENKKVFDFLRALASNPKT